jgi:5-methylcytosine-specific restriction endonuclease McrA
MCPAHYYHWRKKGDPLNFRRIKGRTNLNARSRGAGQRAKKLGLPYERISAEVVIVRDGWICGLCSCEIDREAVWPQPQSASIDHIIPVSRGGSHTYDNVQAAHLVCNLRKGNR